VSKPRPRYTLVLEALPAPVPVGRRLAGLLKVALRAFRLRAIRVAPLPAAAGADTPQRGSEVQGDCAAMGRADYSRRPEFCGCQRVLT
jgi:hypothetical protein